MRGCCLELSMAGLDPAIQPVSLCHWMAASGAAMERGWEALKELALA